VWLLMFLIISPTAILLWMFLAPWGHTASNEVLLRHLQNFSAGGMYFTSICKFKQYCNGIWPSGFASMDVGRQSDGQIRSPDLFNLYHHEGIILELVAPSGVHSHFLELEYGVYGLLSHISDLGVIRDIMPWDGPGCDFWCGAVPPENADPLRIEAKLEELRGRHYNGFTFNCLEFSELIWSVFAPVAQGCQGKPPVSTRQGVGPALGGGAPL